MYRERSTRLRRLLAKRVLFVLTFVMAAATTFFAGAPTAWAADVTCTGVMSGGTSGPLNIKGNVNVPKDANCTLSFVNVTGNVQADQGSTLLITAYTEPSTIGGNVQANNCYSALLEGTVTVGGNVQIQQCNGNGPNGFQGPDIVINGNFQCQGNSSNAASCLAWLGKVHGNVQIQANHGPTAPDISLVTVGGNLICQQNSAAPTHEHGPSWVDGNSLGQCSGFATATTSISNGPVSPAASCSALASLPASGFPVPNTVITSAVDTAATSSLPERCIVNGYVNRHVSPVDNCFYQEGFQVQLPLSAAWNGRFWMQGGGGTEGSVPAATGTDSGSAGSNFGINNGFAVATQDGGHENTDLAVASCDSGYGNPKEYDLDPYGLAANAYQSIEVTALTAKYIVDEYYGNEPKYSYWVGCSTGGRQAMVMSQTFPQFFDGIVAGDPVYNLEDLGISGIYSLQQIFDLAPASSYTYVTGAAPSPPEPILYPSFPASDQALFETALLQACDALDGVSDGVIDNLPACIATFNPTTATYTSSGTTFPLQCTGAKNATCLSPAQIQAIVNINQGPRTTAGMPIEAPAVLAVHDHVDATAQGLAYDGGFMASSGLPTWKIGRPTSPAGDYPLDGTAFGYSDIVPANPALNPMMLNFTTEQGLLAPSLPSANTATSLDISKFINYGHKIIWYHGLSDTLAPVLGTLVYYNEMAAQQGGLAAVQRFSRLYLVPNMGHCSGNPATDQFDMFTALEQWVENGTAPGPVAAKGVNFTATTYQVGFVSGVPDNAPTTRSRPLCPYPQQARFTASTTTVSGVPVASNPSDLANSANYTCVAP